MVASSLAMSPISTQPERVVTDPRFDRQPLRLHRASLRVVEPTSYPHFAVSTAGVATWQADLILQMFIGCEERRLEGTVNGRVLDLVFPAAYVAAITVVAIVLDRGLGSVQLVGLAPIEKRDVRKACAFCSDEPERHPL